MVNSADFAKRLQEIMDYHTLSASGFAERIGVQRSSISHLLSGRNKPSLDFILKVTHEFTDVNLYWLLNGKGNFPDSTPLPTPQEFFPNLDPNKGKEIKKIVIFYENGRFEVFEN